MNAQEIYNKRIEEAARECDYQYEKEELAFISGGNYALKNQWISVEEALPEERDEEDEQYSTNVFVRTKDCIRYAYYDFYNESWCSVEGGYRFGGDVTHWMSVPGLEGGEE
jgi:tRNA splicing endonuclease